VGGEVVLLVEAQNKQEGKWSPPATRPSSLGFLLPALLGQSPLPS